jgi:hypothetical protein
MPGLAANSCPAKYGLLQAKKRDLESAIPHRSELSRLLCQGLDDLFRGIEIKI